jgi:hypothetical protein
MANRAASVRAAAVNPAELNRRVALVRSATAKAGVLPVPRLERRTKTRQREREALYTYGCLPVEVPECWLAQFSDTSCSGRLERAHLIRAQTVRREVSRDRAIVWDERIVRWACHLHHGQFDQTRALRVPRSALPASVEQFAADHGLGWFLDRTYGERMT